MEKVKRVFIIGCCSLVCLIFIQSLIVQLLFDNLVKILIVEISLFLVLICLLGCSVYHVQMWRDANSGTSLLNNLHTITAIIMQVQSVLLCACAQIFDNVFCPKNKTMINYVSMLLWFSRILNFFHMIFGTIMNVYRQYKPTEYLHISVDPRGKWIILSLEFFASFLFITLQLWNECLDNWIINTNKCSMITRVVRIVGPFLMIVCVLLLLKVTEDGYGISKRTNNCLSLLSLRNQNMVTPEEQLHPINDDQVGKHERFSIFGFEKN